MHPMHVVRPAAPPAANGSFAEQLRQHRRGAGLTQEALAERAGLSVRAISDLERGLKAPQRVTVDMLSRALALTTTEARQFMLAAQQRREQRESSDSDALPAAPALPAPLTSFIGRERELADVKQALEQTRLLTLVGTGGCGKTRLAQQVAADVLECYPDGVWLVELAPLADAGLVPVAVAGALGIREQPGRPLVATLIQALRPRRLLLLLDNCEHLLAGCAQLADALLHGCPGLTILATSRQALGIAGEASRRVPSLAFPTVDDNSVEQVANYDAVRLFRERARAVQPGFQVTPQNASALAQLCRRLDGIPLALELAAVRTRALSVDELAARLDQRFRLLTGGSRTALPRQQTLRATIDWSYDLLDARERRLFARLSVFAGGWTLEAAEAVGPGEAMEPDEVLDLLARLVDKSLVQAEEQPDGSLGYRLLETLRAYALGKLYDSGETVAAQAAHAAYFAAWVGGPGPQPVTNVIELLGTPTSISTLAPAARALDNLRAALAWFLERGEAEAGLGLAARIHHLWFVLGPREEGRAWLRRFLALPSAASAPSRAAALYAAGWLAQFQGDLADAHAAYAEAAALALAGKDRRGQAYARTALGVVAFLQGAPARAELEEGIRLAREAEAADVLLDGLANLGTLAIAQGDLAGARDALTEGRAALPRYPVLRFRFHWLAGELALAEGDGERAAQEYRAGLADRSAAGDPVGVAASTLGLAAVAACVGDGARAAQLLGGSEGIALAVAGRLLVQPLQRDQHARVEVAARALLGEAAFTALRAEGRRLGVDAVVRLALGEDGDG